MSAHGSYEQRLREQHRSAHAGQCNATGVNGQTDAATKGTISTIAFIGGGVAALAGALLFLTAPSGASHAQVAVGPGSVLLTGRF